MNELVQWLRAQLDEDRGKAEAAIAEARGAAWEYRPGRVLALPEEDMVAVGSQDYLEPGVGEHVAEHDPARVLREIDAKRQLLARHRPYVPEPDQACLGCAGGIMFSSCPVMRLLALPYADRPGYREEWRP